jgi:F-type H+-transporting ATPase subunit gamma
MTDRLAEVSARLQAVRQVAAVVNAMRGMAGSRAQQARTLSPAAQAYAEVACRATAQAVQLEGQEATEASRQDCEASPLLIVFGAEQGFAGGFSDRVLEVAGRHSEAEWLVVGARTALLASERGRQLLWKTSLPARAAALPATAAAVAEALYEAIARKISARVDMVVPVWTGGVGIRVECRALLPLGTAVLAAVGKAARLPPLVTLTPAVLLTRVTEEYVYARICEAAVEAYVAENEARATAMAAAHSKIETQLAALQLLEHRVRQEAITAEVVELAGRTREGRGPS